MLRALAVSADGARGRRGLVRPPARVDHPRSLTAVVLAGGRRGLAVAPQLAAFTASLGIRTSFVMATNPDAAASLWAACSTDRRAELRSGLLVQAGTEPAVASAPPPAAARGVSFQELLTSGSRM